MEINKVICKTPDQFHSEVEKWQKNGAAPIIRGRKLIAFGEEVAELATSHGGIRQGAGRPSKGDRVQVAVRINKEAASILKSKNNQSEYIEQLILQNK